MKWTCYYYYENQSRWVGLCTDLDVAAQGDSLGEAQEELRDALLSYLSDVLMLPPDEQVRFLHRKSPLSVRVSLWVRRAVEESRLVRARVLGQNQTRRMSLGVVDTS